MDVSSSQQQWEHTRISLAQRWTTPLLCRCNAQFLMLTSLTAQRSTPRLNTLNTLNTQHSRTQLDQGSPRNSPLNTHRSPLDTFNTKTTLTSTPRKRTAQRTPLTAQRPNATSLMSTPNQHSRKRLPHSTDSCHFTTHSTLTTHRAHWSTAQPPCTTSCANSPITRHVSGPTSCTASHTTQCFLTT